MSASWPRRRRRGSTRATLRVGRESDRRSEPSLRGRAMYVSSSLTPDEQRCERWEADRRILRERLPKVRHLVLAGSRIALAEGIVDVDAGAGGFESVQIEMVFSARYPDEPPCVWERGGRWT